MKFLKIILFILGAIVAANAFGKAPEKSAFASVKDQLPGRKAKKIKNYTHTAPAKGTQVGRKMASKRSYRHSLAS